ncbi:MAG: hydrolase [Desulfobacterales bacterium]
MLRSENAVLVVVDVQGKLAEMMHSRDAFFKNLGIMIEGAKILEIPILWLEQIPEKLGATTPEIAQLLTGLTPISKHTFSAWGNENFRKAFISANRKQVILTGIETHICVYQTARSLAEHGYEVHVAADAVASRYPENKEIGLEKIRNAGGIMTSVETALFEIMKEAGGEKFRQIVKIIR